MLATRRNEYQDPGVISAVAQVVLDWTSDQMHAFCKSTRETADQTFRQVTENTIQSVNFDLSQPVPVQTVKQEFGGSTIDLGDGGFIIIEPTGFRVALGSPYPGRIRLLELVQWVTDQIKLAQPLRRVTRVSIIYTANIDPGEGAFRIEEYIVPNFEFADPALNTFDAFRHDVMINLTEAVSLSHRARIVIETSGVRRGVDFSVDVLDDANTDLNQVQKRLEVVKDLETHIFESIITQRTREIYGISMSPA